MKKSHEEMQRLISDSEKILKGAGIKFIKNNNGYHFVIDLITDKINFWPTSGKYQYNGQLKILYGSARDIVKQIKVKKQRPVDELAIENLEDLTKDELISIIIKMSEKINKVYSTQPVNTTQDTPF